MLHKNFGLVLALLGFFGLACTVGSLFAADTSGGGKLGTRGNPQTIVGAYPVLKASTLQTRPANTTTYAANTAWCQSTSVNCTPMSVSLANTSGGGGLITRVTLLKSGSSTTNATFQLWIYSQTPTVTSIHDASAYVGPFAADMPNYIGSATCATTNLTNDATAQVWYECTLSNPNVGGLSFSTQAGATSIYIIPAVTAAYTPASAEVLTAYVSGIY